MKLYRDDPCSECPYRRRAPPGWLGGHPVEVYAEHIRRQAPVACHKTVRSDGQGQPHLCTGWAQALNNGVSTPRDDQLAAEVAKAGTNPEVFSWAAEFEKHHNQDLGAWVAGRLKEKTDEN